jgi:hypothetical protein
MSFEDNFIECHRVFCVLRAIALIDAEANSLITLSADDKLFLASALEHELLES